MYVGAKRNAQHEDVNVSKTNFRVQICANALIARMTMAILAMKKDAFRMKKKFLVNYNTFDTKYLFKR